MSYFNIFLFLILFFIFICFDISVLAANPHDFNTLVPSLDVYNHVSFALNGFMVWLGSIFTVVIPFGIVLVMLRSVPRVINRIIMAFT